MKKQHFEGFFSYQSVLKETCYPPETYKPDEQRNYINKIDLSLEDTKSHAEFR